MNSNPLYKNGKRRYHDSTPPEEFKPDLRDINLNEISLTGLADLFGTDKGSFKHNFTKTYENLINKLNVEGVDKNSLKINLAEFGIACGASLKMWSSYLPKASIDGFDLREDCSNLCSDIDNVSIIIKDPTKDKIACNHYYNLIIDDASHISEQIVFAFKKNWNCLKPGGFYVIEDVACTYNSKYTKEFNATFKTQFANTRSIFMDLIDLLMRSADQMQNDVKSLKYSKQLLIIEKKYFEKYDI